jgi:hypothetical protein
MSISIVAAVAFGINAIEKAELFFHAHFYCKPGGVRSCVLLCFWSLGIVIVLGVEQGSPVAVATALPPLRCRRCAAATAAACRPRFSPNPNAPRFPPFLLRLRSLKRALQFTTVDWCCRALTHADEMLQIPIQYTGWRHDVSCSVSCCSS